MPNTIQEKDADFIHQVSANPAEIDLRELFSVLWAGRVIIIAITFLFAIGAVGVALWLPNVYKSEVTLAPAEESQGGGLSALANQFGGLASLAGVNLGKSSTDKTALAIEVMKSRKFTADFIANHNIMAQLMAVKKWDDATNKLIFDPDVYDADTDTWVRDVKAPKKPEPSMQEAFKEFSKILEISKDKDTGLVIISIEHKSPFVAKKWVEWLVSDINHVMKERDVAEAKRSVAYLENQIQQTNIADIRVVLYKLVEEQAKTIMLAEVRSEYIFKTIDPALVPEEKFKPKRAIICLVITFLGLFISLTIVIFLNYFRTSSPTKKL